MAKFDKVCAFAIVLFGVLALCQGDAIDDQLRNTPLVEKTIRCVLDQERCDVFGATVKGRLIEYFGNGCGRCSKKQLDDANRVGAFLGERYPSQWATIVAKYQKRGRRG